MVGKCCCCCACAICVNRLVGAGHCGSWGKREVVPADEEPPEDDMDDDWRWYCAAMAVVLLLPMIVGS